METHTDRSSFSRDERRAMTELGESAKYKDLSKSHTRSKDFVRVPMDEVIPRLIDGSITHDQLMDVLGIRWKRELPRCLRAKLRYSVIDKEIVRTHVIEFVASTPTLQDFNAMSGWICRHADGRIYGQWCVCVNEYLDAQRVIKQLQKEERVRHGG
jgi:hypothetical protein